MELDYRNMMDLVQIRQKQIEDVALEREYFNTEYTALEEIRQKLAKILILERTPVEKFLVAPINEVQVKEPTSDGA